MRKWRGGGLRRVGCAVVLLGVLVFLAIVLPAEFWWFVLGFVLIVAGIYIIRCF